MSRVIRSRAERLAGFGRVLEARSSNSTGQRLRELAQDEIRPVRLWTARNRRCPPDGLVALAHDDDVFVRWNALMNAALPVAGLRYLCQLEADEGRSTGQPSFIVRSRVLAHPNVSAVLAKHLRELGAITEPWVTRFYSVQQHNS